MPVTTISKLWNGNGCMHSYLQQASTILNLLLVLYKPTKRTFVKLIF